MAKSKTEKYKAIAAKLSGGPEPRVTADNYKTELMVALCYYNAHVDDKTLAKRFIDYVKKQDKTLVSTLSKAPTYELTSVGKLVSILNNGGFLRDDHKQSIDIKAKELFNKYSQVTKVDATDDAKPKRNAPVISIEQRIIDAARAISEDIDYAIDGFLNTKASTFSTKSFLLQKSVSGAVAKHISKYYEAPLNEAKEAYEGKCEQLAEGYSFFTKSELKKFIGFLESIVNDCKQHTVTAKKPRIQRAKPPGVIVKKLKYKVKDDELDLRSVDPATIVGADVVYIYNTKTRKLFRYESDHGALSVKGTTIINYSVSTSDVKMLRKPEVFFKGLKICKREMIKQYNDLKTKPSAVNGRVNDDCIILGAFE